MAVSSVVMSLGRWALAILWIAAIARSALAADAAANEPPVGRAKFRVFAGADGLHNLGIRSIAQDAAGMLWLATDDGVYRYDGDRFALFTAKHGLPATVRVVLAVAPDGALCAGGATGLVCWDGDRFSPAGAQGLPSSLVTAMVASRDKLWVGGAGGALHVRTGNGPFVPAPGWDGVASGVRAMWADADGVVIGNGATVELSTGNGVWRNLGVRLSDEVVEGVLRDRQRALWIRTQSHLWYVRDGATEAIDLHAGLPTAFDASGATVTMAIGPRGDVLVATDDGLAYRDGDRWRVIDAAAGLPRATVRTLFVDREGTVWLASAGLVQMRGRGLLEYHSPASGLPGETVWLIERDREGRLLLGTNRCLVRATAGRWECVPGTEGRFVSALAFPRQGGMFVGGAPSDLLYIDPSGHVTSLEPRGTPDRNIIALTIGPDGDLWIGRSEALDRLRGAVPGPIERVDVPGVVGERITSIVTSGDRLWMASESSGIIVRDRGSWRRFGTADGFLDDATAHLMARSDGRMCTTYGRPLGVTCFRYDGRKVVDLEHLGVASGLSTGSVYTVGEDRERRLWVATGNGIDLVTSSGVDHLDETDGLAGNDSAAKAFLLDRDGSVWVGATGGVTHVLAQYYRGPPPPPRTVFLDGKLGDHPIHTALGPHQLELPHHRGSLNVELAAATLIDGKRVVYQERLSPLETEWSIGQRHVRYPGLQPGAYRFEVRARVGSGPWGPVSELRFAVLPAWWQTRWFIVLAIVLGLAAIAAGFTWRNRSMLLRRTGMLNAQAFASFRAVVDLMPEMISVHRGSELVYLNLAMRRLFGLDGPDGVDQLRDVSERIHPADQTHAAAMFARVAQLAPQQVSEITEIRLRSADDSYRICEVSGIRVEIGGVLTVVISGRDLTERKRLAAQLMVTDRMASLGTLAAGIAHEINNPLAYVTGNLEAIEETLGGEPGKPETTAATRREIFAAIHDARDGAERVRKIVHGLRSFSRPDEDKRVSLDLRSLLDSAIRMTANELRNRAKVVLELGTVPRVLGDDGRLTQVFINLLINAAHAIAAGSPDHNRITVRTRTDARGQAVVEIVDTGKGMTPEVVSHVFDPFFTTQEVGGGAGLGLSICHGVIRALGGHITIESPPERKLFAEASTRTSRLRGDSGPNGGPSAGPGTLVRVVLPPHAALVETLTRTAAGTGGPDVSGAARRHRVMIVDDEPMVAQTMGRLLRGEYDVTIAQCGQEAIDHIVAKGTRFDAIVSDVMMPNMTGIELIEELQRVAPDQAQRLIFLSGGAFTDEARTRLDQIGAPQLEKPISARDLRAWVLRVVRDTTVPVA